jgi:hypothetical protein
MPCMETMPHRWCAEIAAEKRSPFRPHRGLTALNLFLDTMLDRRIEETRPIGCTESLGNTYRNKSQTGHLKGKIYRDAQLEELIHSTAVGHAPKHEVICGSKPTGEKSKEGETTPKWQPPRASGCEAVKSSLR